MRNLDAINKLLQFEEKSMLYNCEKFPMSFLSQFLYFLCNCIYCLVKKLNSMVHA